MTNEPILINNSQIKTAILKKVWKKKNREKNRLSSSKSYYKAMQNPEKKEQIRLRRKRYYDKIKSDFNFKQKRSESNRKYYLKCRSLNKVTGSTKIVRLKGKKCSRCKTYKPINEFPLVSDLSGRLRLYCCECRRIYDKIYHYISRHDTGDELVYNFLIMKTLFQKLRLKRITIQQAKEFYEFAEFANTKNIEKQFLTQILYLLEEK